MKNVLPLVLPKWMKKLFNVGGKEALEGASKHGRGKQRPKGWHRALRNARKRQRMARKRNR